MKTIAALLVLLFAVPALAEKTQMQVGLSARLCNQRQWRLDNLQRIAEELHRGKIGGVVDKAEIYSDERAVSDVNGEISRSNEWARAKHVRSCKDPDVAAVMACTFDLRVGPEAVTSWGDRSDPRCARPEISGTVHFVAWAFREIIDEALDTQNAAAQVRR